MALEALPCRDGASAEEHHDVVIHANELAYKEGISTGDILRYTDCSHHV